MIAEANIQQYLKLPIQSTSDVSSFHASEKVLPVQFAGPTLEDVTKLWQSAQKSEGFEENKEYPYKFELRVYLREGNKIHQRCGECGSVHIIEAVGDLKEETARGSEITLQQLQ